MKSYWWDRLLSMEGQNVHLGKVMLCPNGIEKGINLVAIIKIKNSFFLSDGLFIVYNVLQIFDGRVFQLKCSLRELSMLAIYNICQLAFVLLR